ncbi:outer membrane beta-barrel protein [Arenibacter sp. M-2]|uniref:outer membrane beta-barrel protein n=1 Tax=Arenibacter sp. M-2 TaxID=3053612 RepID=UPI002570EC4B|nr:outer membrane beta-barrel protein [Arenibacter sp. M-2]MDL5514570.1 outer membrane beta-barrel protein [Arenibacter sp. M-2]
MKKYIFVIAFSIATTIVAQESNYYFGVSYGKSFPLGDFAADDIANSNSGFAESGNKLDVYGGAALSEKLNFTLTFRYQNFDTDIYALVEESKTTKVEAKIVGSSDDWKTYSLLAGIEYKINIGRKFSIYPRIGLGPILVSNPPFTIAVTNENANTEVIRSSETGFGLGYELGIGLKRDIGNYFCLMPTFTFSGGFVTIPDVDTTIDNLRTTLDYMPKIITFNLGLSLAYKF